MSAPTICPPTKPETEESLIPENVSEKARATVTAGLAKDVEEVKN